MPLLSQRFQNTVHQALVHTAKLPNAIHFTCTKLPLESMLDLTVVFLRVRVVLAIFRSQKRPQQPAVWSLDCPRIRTPLLEVPHLYQL